MRVVLQRVSRAAVFVHDSNVSTAPVGAVVPAAPVGAIDAGFVALVAIAQGDTTAQVDAMAAKTIDLRVFADAEGLFNQSLAEVHAAVLVVSQFTLLANVRKGRRPSFDEAAPPKEAAPLVERYAQQIEAAGVPVQRGWFGAHMEVELVNDGPVTIVVDSADLERPRRGGATSA